MVSDDLASTPVVPETDLAFRVRAGALVRALERATAVMPSGHLYEVLRNVHLDVGDGLRLGATDNDLAVVLHLDAEVIRPGEGILPGKQLLDVVGSVPADTEVVIDVKDGVATLTVQVGRTQWDLRVPDVSLFPDLPDLGEVAFYAVTRKALMEAVAAVRSTVSTETLRPQLQMVDITAGAVRSSDSARLQQVMLDDWPADLSVQIPAAAVDTLLGVLRSSSAKRVDVGETEDFFAFRVGAETFTMTRLVEPFPEVLVERLLDPALSNPEVLVVDRQALLDAIRRVRSTADTETSAVMLAARAGLLTVSSRDRNQNQSRTEVEVDWDGKPYEAAFRYQHLTDVLRTVKTETCRFLVSTQKKTMRSPVCVLDESMAYVGVLSQLRVDAL